MSQSASLADGQRDALAELRLIEAQAGGLRLESWRVDGGWLVAVIALACQSISAELAPGGLKLRGREFMEIHVPPSYPLKPPRLSVSHSRFAGFENVMREGGICSFRSPDTEWNPSDGMAVFVRDRVWGWLRRATRNEVEDQGGIFHAPVRHDLQPVPGVIRYDVLEPAVGGVWTGFTSVRLLSPARYGQTGPELDRFSLARWSDKPGVRYRDHVVGAALLLPVRMGFYFPRTLGDLMRSVSGLGLSPERMVEHLGGAARESAVGSPLLFTVGVPLSRLDQEKGGRKHSLTTLLLADEASRLLWAAGGTRRKEDAVATVVQRADELPVYVLFDRDHRAGVTVRRDSASPAAWFAGKTVAVWGAGALGAPLAIQIARAGAARVILRDNGYVHRGLLARQPYTEDDEEVLKVDALRHRLKAIRPALRVTTGTEDLRSDLSGLEEWHGGVDLIVNATASVPVRAALDLARVREEAQRVSVLTVGVDAGSERGFARLLLPSAPFSIEELEREVQLRIARDNALSPYADAFFPSEQSERREPFYPEPGCSDATFTGSAADMAALSGAMLNWAASSLAKEPEGSGIALLTSQPHVTVEGGEPAVHVVRAPVRTPLADERCGYTVRVNPEVLEQIQLHVAAAAVRSGPEAETGGPLWGAYDDVRRVIWLDAAGPAPPDSVEAEDRFVCGVVGLSEEATERSAATRGAVGFVGTWHTHPASAPVPSGRDRASMADVCTRMEPLPRRFLMMIVGSPLGDPEYRAYVFRRDEFVAVAQA